MNRDKSIKVVVCVHVTKQNTYNDVTITQITRNNYE